MRTVRAIVIGAVAILLCGPAFAQLSEMSDTDISVDYVADYFWPDVITIAGSDGDDYQIDTFSLVSVLLVTRRDGQAFTLEDELVARQAASKVCTDGGLELPEGPARLNDGAWAFPACQP